MCQLSFLIVLRFVNVLIRLVILLSDWLQHLAPWTPSGYGPGYPSCYICTSLVCSQASLQTGRQDWSYVVATFIAYNVSAASIMRENDTICTVCKRALASVYANSTWCCSACARMVLFLATIATFIIISTLLRIHQRWLWILLHTSNYKMGLLTMHHWGSSTRDKLLIEHSGGHS